MMTSILGRLASGSDLSAAEMEAAIAGGVTSLACPPDTDPPLDEPGLVEMLTFRTKTLNRARVYPVGALPVRADTAWMGAGYSLWYQSGGTQGVKPTEPELLKALELLQAGASATDAERIQMAKEIWRLEVEQQWAIGLVGQSPAYMGIRIVSDRLGNTPSRTCTSQQCRTPWSARPEQWYFK